MVNKRAKTEGAKTATITAPKRRTATKPKAATARVIETAPVAEPAAKPAKAIIAKTSSNGSAIRQEDIAFRAYLIGEKRQQLGLPGDSLSDWVEAERQLLGERATYGVN